MSVKKKTAETPKPVVQFIELDAADKAFIGPRVQKALAGKQATVEVNQYVQSIVRRSGFAGKQRIAIDPTLTKIVVTPE